MAHMNTICHRCHKPLRMEPAPVFTQPGWMLVQYVLGPEGSEHVGQLLCSSCYQQTVDQRVWQPGPSEVKADHSGT